MDREDYMQQRRELIELLRLAEQDRSQDGIWAETLLREALARLDRAWVADKKIAAG